MQVLQSKLRAMKIKFYGTRGSLPVCEREFQVFGGNTTCISLTGRNNGVAILDAGTGIRNLGKDLTAKGHEQFGNIYIGFSHFHWDHIQGFPFFLPAYDSRRHFTISAIGKGRSAKNLRGIFATQMLPEYFPVALDQMGAKFSFHQSETDHFISNGVKVTVAEHNHPGGTYGYRIEDVDGKVLVYCTDVEHGDTIDQRIVQLAKDADFLIHDAQYTPKELKGKKGWGHSSWEQAIEVAERAGVNQLALTHHDPDHNDEFLLEVEKECRTRFPKAFLAREKAEIEF
jgi:phosphoribosyl 1,2-cyclic phosphodiesterase